MSTNANPSPSQHHPTLPPVLADHPNSTTQNPQNPPPTDSNNLSPPFPPFPDPKLHIHIQQSSEPYARYHTLPTRPKFIARSSSLVEPWIEPWGLEAYSPCREIRAVGSHRICDVWERGGGDEGDGAGGDGDGDGGGIVGDIVGYLEGENVQWTTIDPLRLFLLPEMNSSPPANTSATKEEEENGPVILWIGVHPGSLEKERGYEVCLGIRDILRGWGVGDVHVEIRESVATFSFSPSSPSSPSPISTAPQVSASASAVSPAPTPAPATAGIITSATDTPSITKLYKPPPIRSLIASALEPFTPTLSIPISPEDNTGIGGNGTLFFTSSLKEGKGKKGLFMLVPGHIVHPHPTENTDSDYVYENEDSESHSDPHSNSDSTSGSEENLREEKEGKEEEKKNIIFLGTGKHGFESHLHKIESQICDTEIRLRFLERCLEVARVDLVHLHSVDSTDSVDCTDSDLEQDSTKKEKKEENEKERKTERNEAKKDIENLQKKIKEAQSKILALSNLLKDVRRDFGDPTKRRIGWVVFAPAVGFVPSPSPISSPTSSPQAQASVDAVTGDCGSGDSGKRRTIRKGHWRDFAIIQIDESIIDSTNFPGNAIDLGTEFAVEELIRLMNPRLQDYSDIDLDLDIEQLDFEYPHDRLLKIKGLVEKAEKAEKGSGNGNGSGGGRGGMMVLKRGAGSGLTVGRLNNLRSIVRHPSTHSSSESVTSPSGVGYSMELAILPPPTSRALQYSGKRARPFGSVGDRGAVVVNGSGGVVGMLLGGSGISSLSRSNRGGFSTQRKWEDEPEEFDISYVSDVRCLRRFLEEFG